MKDWHDMRNDEFEKYLIEVYGDTSWKAYLFKTRPPQIITVLCGVLSIIIRPILQPKSAVLIQTTRSFWSSWCGRARPTGRLP